MERNGTKIEKKKDYLFSMYVNNLAYNKAKEFFLTLKNDEVQIGGCSSVRNGNWYGRNYDWMYDETAEFLVRTPRANGKNRTIGMCAGLTALTNSVVTEDITEGTWNELYSIVPFMMLDGINGYGLIANMNVVPTDKGETEETVPTVEKRESICSLMLVRYILDNFKTATEAVNYIRDYVAIYMPDVLQEQHYETHIMIADNSKTYLLEFIDNENVVIDMSDSPYATNFYLDGVTLNQDGTVYTPATQDETHTPTETNGITALGSGLERWNYIVGNYDTCNTLQGMKSLMNGLRYTNTYDTTMDTFWWTEFVGVPYGEGQMLTVDSSVSDYETYAEPYIEKFSQRSRNPLSEGYGTWQTVHSVVYDMRNKKMYLIVQEDGEEIMSELYEDMLIPIAPTQPQGDNSNKIATTEYVDSALQGKADKDRAYDLYDDFTIIYPNGGTEGNPANITVNSRYVMDNPFPGYHVDCVVEVIVDGMWGTPNLIYESGMQGTCVAMLDDNEIVVKTGSTYIIGMPATAGTPFPSGGNLTSAPCRVKVWKIGKVANA